MLPGILYLTFYLALYDMYSGILCDIYSDILSGILFDILSGTSPDIYFLVIHLTYIPAFCLAFCLTINLTLYLANKSDIRSGILCLIVHPAFHLAVEIQRCPLRSEAGQEAVDKRCCVVSQCSNIAKKMPAEKCYQAANLMICYFKFLNGFQV